MLFLSVLGLLVAGRGNTSFAQSAWTDPPRPSTSGEAVKSRPAFLRLPLETRTKLVIGLAVVVLLGVMSVLAIRAIGRLVRLYADGSRYQPVHGGVNRDDWAAKPLSHDGGHDDPKTPFNADSGES